MFDLCEKVKGRKKTHHDVEDATKRPQSGRECDKKSRRRSTFHVACSSFLIETSLKLEKEHCRSSGVGLRLMLA